MEIIEIDKSEYKRLVVKPFSKFETVEFAGIKDNILKFPFSATYSMFSEVTQNNKINCYYETISALNNWAKNNNIKKIIINTPALSYDSMEITKLHNALLQNEFKIKSLDVNFEYNLENFDDEYISKIHHSARKALKAAIKNNLKFKKTDDVKSVYEIIKRNREYRGFPLRMNLEEIIKTSKVIDSDYFIVTDSDDRGIASAFIHHLRDDLVRVVYWGNTPESEALRPVNFIAYNIFKFYKESGKKLVDIGTSTVDGQANYGLCDFKENIGCSCSPKINFEEEFFSHSGGGQCEPVRSLAALLSAILNKIENEVFALISVVELILEIFNPDVLSDAVKSFYIYPGRTVWS